MTAASSPLDPQLDDLWNGIIQDHFRAEMALNLYGEIGRRADEINQATFGRFFWAVEMFCQRDFHIAVGCLFEREKRGYKIRSIPALLSWLYDHADTAIVHNPDALKEYLIRQNRYANTMTHAELTRAFVDDVRSRMPVDNKPETNNLSAAWDNVKRVRDKGIAHNEIRDAEQLTSSYDDVDQLLLFAAAFIKLIGGVYINTTLISESDRPARSMRRLLKKAGIEPKDDSTLD